MLQWESPHERNAFVLLDTDPSVTAFREQPVVIEFIRCGIPQKHYPDILVEYATGVKELWEVKPQAEAADLNVAARTALMEEQLPGHGFQYRLVTAESLGMQPQLANALTLLKYGRRPISKFQREHLPGQWDASMLIAETIVPWTVEWLIAYEGWRATGVWTAGGHGTERRAA